MDNPVCSCCGEPAVVHLHQTVGGVDRRIELCENCARYFGVLLKAGASFPVISSIGSTLFDQFKKAEPRVCPKCGCSSIDVKSKGRFGCSYCYTVFEYELFPIVHRMQKSFRHIGKRSKLFGGEAYSRDDKLLGELSRAIREERFEDAASIRDKIGKEPGDE